MEITVRFPNLGFMFQYEDRTFSVLGFEITIYGILIAVSMLLGFAAVIWYAKKQGENQNLYLGAAIAALLGGVIGARLYYIAFSWSKFSGKPIKYLCDIRSGGMAIYGGILAGALVTLLFCKIFKLSFGQVADTLSVGLLSAQVIGVWGNFFNRESFGQYTEGLLAMRLPLESVQSSMVTKQMRDHLVTIDGTPYIQAHPLFLYESVWCLLLLIVLVIYCRHRKFHGEIFMRYLAGYGLGKCVIEWLRTDKLCIPGTDISVSLIISVALFLICGVMAAVRRSFAKKREVIEARRKRIAAISESSESDDDESEISEDSEKPEEVQEEVQEEVSEEISGEPEKAETETESESETSDQ